jgi:hypothetical protein
MKHESVQVNTAVVADFNNSQAANRVRFEVLTAVNMKNIIPEMRFRAVW